MPCSYPYLHLTMTNSPCVAPSSPTMHLSPLSILSSSSLLMQKWYQSLLKSTTAFANKKQSKVVCNNCPSYHVNFLLQRPTSLKRTKYVHQNNVHNSSFFPSCKFHQKNARKSFPLSCFILLLCKRKRNFGRPRDWPLFMS